MKDFVSPHFPFLFCTGDVWSDTLIILQNQVSHGEREMFLVFGYVPHLPFVGVQLPLPCNTIVIVFHLTQQVHM